MPFLMYPRLPFEHQTCNRFALASLVQRQSTLHDPVRVLAFSFLCFSISYKGKEKGTRTEDWTGKGGICVFLFYTIPTH